MSEKLDPYADALANDWAVGHPTSMYEQVKKELASEKFLLERIERQLIRLNRGVYIIGVMMGIALLELFAQRSPWLRRLFGQ
jgi:hypothetical protein